MATKIAFANLKGGVGKTVSSINVYSALQELGYKVLLVDMDPQVNSSIAVRAVTEDVPTLYDIFFGGYKADQVIQTTELGVDIIPSDTALINIDSQITPGPNMYRYVKKALKCVEDKYDFIIMDLCPHTGILLGNANMYADFLITPAEMELFCISGLLELSANVTEFKEDNEGLCILGLLKVKYKKNQRLTKDLEESVLPRYAEQIGAKIFNSTIRESVKCKEAIVMRELLRDYDHSSTTYQDYLEFTKELIEEIRKVKGE